MRGLGWFRGFGHPMDQPEAQQIRTALKHWAENKVDLTSSI